MMPLARVGARVRTLRAIRAPADFVKAVANPRLEQGRGLRDTYVILHTCSTRNDRYAIDAVAVRNASALFRAMQLYYPENVYCGLRLRLFELSGDEARVDFCSTALSLFEAWNEQRGQPGDRYVRVAGVDMWHGFMRVLTPPSTGRLSRRNRRGLLDDDL